jgi:hypothetical protein
MATFRNSEVREGRFEVLVRVLMEITSRNSQLKLQFRKVFAIVQFGFFCISDSGLVTAVLAVL